MLELYLFKNRMLTFFLFRRDMNEKADVNKNNEKWERKCETKQTFSLTESRVSSCWSEVVTVLAWTK